MTNSFFEVHVHCTLDTLVQRDPKGLYAKAIAGDIPNFTGVSDPYEAPENAEVVVNTAEETPDESVAIIITALQQHGYLESVDQPSTAAVDLPSR